MFAPEGFISIPEARLRIPSIHWSRKHKMSSRDSFEELVFETIADNGGFFICSPEGKLLKIEESPLITRTDMRSISRLISLDQHPLFFQFDQSEIEKVQNFWAAPLFFDRSNYLVSLEYYDAFDLRPDFPPIEAKNFRQILSIM